MTLSVVIPAHNQPALLAQCLTSVTAHAPVGTQVIVVDDGSRNAIVSQVANAFPKVQLIRHEKAKGFCGAANAGILASTGIVVEMLNDDTQVGPGWADVVLKHFEDAKNVAVAPLVWQGTPETVNPKIDSAGDVYDTGGFASKRNMGTHVIPMAGPVWGVSATAGFYRRSTLVDAGLFPVHFGAYFEDVDLSFRLRKQGDILFEPCSQVWHVGHSSYGRKPSRRTLERQSCNEERVFWRNCGKRNLPRHIMVLGAKACKRWEEGTLVPWTLGRIRAWCGQ